MFSEEACNDGKPVELTHDDGLVTSPNYDQGNYPNNANCQWLIKTSFGYVSSLQAHQSLIWSVTYITRLIRSLFGYVIYKSLSFIRWCK